MRDQDDGGASGEILRRLANIEKKVESLDETNAFAMRSNRDAHRKTLDDIFGRSARRAQVYLAANGKRSVNEITQLLGMKHQNVSAALGEVEKGGLLSVTSVAGSSYWNKKPIDSSLGISELLMDKFKLTADGAKAT